MYTASMATALYTTEDYLAALSLIMGDESRKRIAVVAFVGADAADLLPCPQGCSVICWPLPGSTNPDGIRSLIKARATVHFCDRLHAKVFWCEGVGAILGSANLSRNALGDGALVEAGVWLSESEFDIERVLTRLNLRAPTHSEMAELDLAHRRFERLNSPTTKRPRKILKNRSFLDWCELPMRPQWKLAPYYGYSSTDVSEEAIATAERDFRATSVWGCVQTEPNDIHSDDWVLCVRCSDSTELMGRSKPSWQYADFVSSESGDEGYDEVCQVHTPSHYPTPPPFDIDKAFVTAFRSVFNESEWDKIYEAGVPCESFIDAVADEYSAE